MAAKPKKGTAKTNPFTLSFGMQPEQLVHRYESVEKVLNTFGAEHSVSQAYLIEGIRGSGKTVLMTSISKKLIEDNRWICVNLNANMDLLADLANQLYEKCSKIPSLLRKGFSFSAYGLGIEMGGDGTLQDGVGKIREMLQGIKKKKKRLLITVDEVIANRNMRIFVSQFQIFLREEYPVYLLMTGLFENIYAVQNDPSLTFLLRTPKIKTEPLSILQIKKHYREIFETDEETVSLLAGLTKGYAFAFQALGAVYWDSRETNGISEKVLAQYDEMLDSFVYMKIWESLTKREREIISALNEGECKVGDICKAISMTSGSFSQYRDRLINRGIIRDVRHGYIELTLPRFSVIAKEY